MRTLGLFSVFSILAMVASSCSLLSSEPTAPEDNPKDLHFDAAYYSQNAKEYFDDGHYGKAKDQWQKQLIKDPNNWMAQLGVASCDYHMGSMSVDLGDLRGARTRLQSAEAATRALWDGTIEADTIQAAQQPVRQWQAALVLAQIHRALADCDRMDARILAQSLSNLRADDERRLETAERQINLERQAEANTRQSLALLDRLVNMGHASEQAILDRAELLHGSGRSREAETDFVTYLDIARKSRANWIEQRQATAEQTGDESVRTLLLEQYDQKIASVSKKQASVLVRLGNIRFDQALRVETSNPELIGSRAQDPLAAEHFGQALDYLREAREVQPEELHLLVKMAQCEGELGLYDAAIGHVNEFLRTSAERNVQADENIHLAYRLLKRLEARQGTAKDSGGR